MTQSREGQAFEKFISTRTILIADASATARSGLFKIFQDLGAKNAQITLVNSFKQASETIPTLKPHIVVAEFDLGKKCGLDLLQRQREQQPKETKDILFVLVTGNTSQSAVARAAEEDIDAYIIKPFTPEVVRKTIMRAALAKIKPSSYSLAVEAGKQAMEQGNLDEAEKTFVEAKALDESPALACYYLGQVKFLRQIHDQAKGSYNKGLEFNKIHYKCMVGLYELLMTQKQHEEAYEVVKRISHYFPANPKRLSEVLRLAIMNAKYEDVERYYSIFCNIDERNDTLIKYICAALVVCGKHYLKSNNRNRAMTLFQKAAATGTGRGKVLRDIIQALVQYALIKEAKEYLAKFPANLQSSQEYKVSRFKILNADGPLPIIIEQGRALIAEDQATEDVYIIMIQRSAEAKFGPSVEALVQEAIKKFPEQKAEFEEVYQSVKT